MEQGLNWFKLVSEHQKLKEKLPYHINLLDELGIDENTHTKILLRLLSYKDKENEQYVILTSFLQLVSKYNYDIPVLFKKPKIDFGKDYIDGRIFISNPSGEEYGIIIENKIYNAVDQDKQIERYIESVHNNGIPYEHIFVIYLTKDGNKKISESSLTDKAKKKLGMNDGDGRFISIDYRHDILPWLQENILPNCKIKEEYLITAIQQYIDFLEGFFNIRKNNKQINNVMKEKLFEEMGLTHSNTPVIKYNAIVKASRSLQSIQTILNNELEELIKDLRQAFENATRTYFQAFRKIGINNKIRQERGFFFVSLEGWGWEVHFEWCPLSLNALMKERAYSFNLNAEGDLKPFKETLLKDREFMQMVEQISGNAKVKNENIVFKKIYQTEKPFAEMTHEEQRAFLETAYKDVTPMIPIIDRLLTEYKKK